MLFHPSLNIVMFLKTLPAEQPQVEDLGVGEESEDLNVIIPIIQHGDRLGG